MTNKKEIEQLPPAIVMPAVTPKEAADAWAQYQSLKSSIATADDVQHIQGKEFYKKSYWRKVATFFNLSVEIVREDKETQGDPVIPTNVTYHFTCRATAPNGRFAEGTGSCDLMEKGRKNTIHNARTTAETRAFNRAVANLVGGGEVSAEEVDEVEHTEYKTEHKSAAPVYSSGACIDCGALVSPGVQTFSMQKYGVVLCMKDQLNHQPVT